MLSIFDLIEAGTLEFDLAAYLMARISLGSSFMVGANPGGAGKTTVMCALLNLLPPDAQILAATPEALVDFKRDNPKSPRCYVCHEISPGHYYAYLWGEDLRDYCSIARTSHTAATNIHADDIEEAHSQVCNQNGVPGEHFNAFNLLIFLRLRYGLESISRKIDKVYASDARSPHTLAYDSTKGFHPLPWIDHHINDMSRVEKCRDFLENAYNDNVRLIEDARATVLDFLKH